MQRPFIAPTRLKMASLAVLSLGALMLTACGTENTQAGAPPAQTMAATADGKNVTSPGNATSGPVPLGSADASMKTLRPEAPAQLMVTDVRTGSHAGFDRVVFDLTGEGEPGWFMDYTDSPSQQGSGNPISYEGATALNVNIDGTVYPFDLGMEDPQIGTVEGAGNLVTEVISAGTFEGRSQFVIGLDGKHPYSVTVLQDPHRLVVDILTR